MYMRVKYIEYVICIDLCQLKKFVSVEEVCQLRKSATTTPSQTQSQHMQNLHIYANQNFALHALLHERNFRVVFFFIIKIPKIIGQAPLKEIYIEMRSEQRARVVWLIVHEQLIERTSSYVQQKRILKLHSNIIAQG